MFLPLNLWHDQKPASNGGWKWESLPVRGEGKPGNRGKQTGCPWQMRFLPASQNK